ncbi:MAG: SET domain-containing protein [Acidimicrobiales bacterium]
MSDAPALRVVAIRGKGRGVVAGRPFAAGEVLEQAPALVIPADEWDLAGATLIARYAFRWREPSGDSALALGRCSLLNHSYSPNAWARNRVRERLIEFVALRDIAEGEEVTINYNGDPDGDAPVDFAVRDGSSGRR